MNDEILKQLVDIEAELVIPALVWEGSVESRRLVSSDGKGLVVVWSCGRVVVWSCGRVVVRYVAVSDIEHSGDEDSVRQSCGELKGKVFGGVSIVDTALEFGVRYGEDGEGTMGVRGNITFQIK